METVNPKVVRGWSLSFLVLFTAVAAYGWWACHSGFEVATRAAFTGEEQEVFPFPACIWPVFAALPWSLFVGEGAPFPDVWPYFLAGSVLNALLLAGLVLWADWRVRQEGL